MASQTNPPATFEQFLIRFSECVERNEKAHGDLKAEIQAAENWLMKWGIGTGIAVVIALGALDRLAASPMLHLALQ